MFIVSFKIVYFTGVLVSLLGAADCNTFDPRFQYKIQKGYLVQKRKFEITKLPNSFAATGQSPHWDHENNSLYYVDIVAGKILRYDYLKKKVYKAKVQGENVISFVIPSNNTNKFVVGCGTKIRVVHWDGLSQTAVPHVTLLPVEERFDTTDIIYGKADSCGRLFLGSHQHNLMYDSSTRWLLEYVYDNRNVTRGLAWNDKTKKIYLSNSASSEIIEYDFYLGVRGVYAWISNPRVVKSFRANNRKAYDVIPRGITIDTAGNLYVATFNDRRLYVINPEFGNVLFTIKFPCLHITSVVFGGPDLDILFVTTSNEGGLPPPCGSVFQITGLGSQGYISNKMLTK